MFLSIIIHVERKVNWSFADSADSNCLWRPNAAGRLLCSLIISPDVIYYESAKSARSRSENLGFPKSQCEIRWWRKLLFGPELVTLLFSPKCSISLLTVMCSYLMFCFLIQQRTQTCYWIKSAPHVLSTQDVFLTSRMISKSCFTWRWRWKFMCLMTWCLNWISRRRVKTSLVTFDPKPGC